MIDRRFKVVACFIALGGICLFLFVILYNQSFIEINVSDNTNSENQLVFVNQKTKKEIKIKTSEDHIKKRLPRGAYEITVKSGNKSYFSITHTKPLLKTSTVDASVKSEKSRTFIGNSPGYCMYYNKLNSKLYSHNCSGTFLDLKIHEPATLDTPTFASSPYNPDRPLKGFVSSGGSLYALLGDSDSPPTNSLFAVQDDLTLTNSVTLKNTDENTSYFIKESEGGFFIFDEEYQAAQYYSSPQANPKTTKLSQPSEPSLAGVSLDIQDDVVAALFSDITVGDPGVTDRGVEEGVSAGKPSEVTITSNNTSKHLKFNKVYSHIGFCGKSKICLLQDKNLEIYDISGKKQRLLNTVTGVSKFIQTDSGLILAREDGVLLVNIEDKNLSGYTQYSYGSYTANCGLDEADNNYIICMTDNDNKTVALYIDQNQDNTDQIDQKILTLSEDPYIENVSTYKSIIYISPMTGESEYNPTTNTYSYNPIVINESKKNIDKLIDKIGIDRNKYQIISTY